MSAHSAYQSRLGSMMEAGMRRTGATVADLALATGYTEASIYRVLQGHRMPTLATASVIAEVLKSHRILELVRRERQVPCANCGTLFVAEHYQRRFCDEACREAAKRRNIRTPPRVVERTLREHRRAVSAFCRSCEPDGTCRQPTCELRPVSPLPVAKRGAA